MAEIYDLPAATAHDESAEKAVLGVVLSDPDAIGEVRRSTSVADFYLPAHQTLFDTICKMDDARKPVEPAAVVSELTATGDLRKMPGGAAYIADLFGSAPPTASVSHYTRIVKDASTRRSLHTVGLRMQQMSAIDGDNTPAEIVDQMRSTLDELAVERLGSDVPLVGDILPITLEEIDKLATHGNVVGVPTGFPDLDRALNGLHPGQMIVIAARPGVGKALTLDTPLRTPDGWTAMGDVKVGDMVVTPEGHPTKVVGVTEVMTNRKCYRVEVAGAPPVIADAEHQWPVMAGSDRFTEGEALQYEIMTTEQMARTAWPMDLIPTFDYPARAILAVTPVETAPVRCIEVEDSKHLYLAGEGDLPTHNSSLAMDVARNAAFRHKKAVMLFSLEMSSPELVMRMLSAEAYIDMQAFKTGDMDEHKWQQLAKAAAKMKDAKLAIDDTATVTISEIRAKARAYQRVHGLDLIVIDYLQLMNSDRRSDNRQQEVSDMSRGVKLLAKEFKVPVIVLSQLNRGSEARQDKRPVISDLRESGSIEQDADVVILIHREEMYEKETPRAGEADIIIAKQRSGPQGVVVLNWIGKFASFSSRTFD